MVESIADFVFKIVAVGSGGVGKTSMIRRFALDKFETSYLITLGVDFTTKELMISDPVTQKNSKVKLVCVDTAGQEYYSKIRPSYYAGANGAFIVFDLTNRNSFESLPRWIAELNQFIPKCPVSLVGNKLDLVENRRINKEEAENFAHKHNIQYFETSAKEGEGIDQVFKFITEEILKKMLTKAV